MNLMKLAFPLAAAACTFNGTCGADVLIAVGPNANAPPEIEQYGQFEGTWGCRSFNRQQDGSWQENPWVSTWVWYYVLDGYAVQDVWIPGSGAPSTAAMGTNLRIYNTEQGQWHMVWTTHGLNEFDSFSAEYTDGSIVMHGELPARGQRGAHLAQITFHNMTNDYFDWKYEFSPLGDGENWTEASKLACTRKSDG